MGFVYEDGKEYKRPGVYRKYTNANTRTNIIQALDGIGKLPIQADWGPLNEVTVHNVSDADVTIRQIYGNGGTVNIANAFMDGGLNTLYLIRVGDGGTKGSTELQIDGSDAVTVTLKYPGTRKFALTVRDKLGSSNDRELIIYDGEEALETITFPTDENEAKALVEAVTAYNSNYITAVAEEAAPSGSIDAVTQQAFTGGVNPTVTTESYGTAFEALEPYYCNTIALDTVDSDVQDLLKEYNRTAFADGCLDISVIGSQGSEDLSTRMSNAASNNNPTIVYFGSDFVKSDGTVVTGAEAIAIVAGVIAATPSNESIVHKIMPKAANVTELLKNRDYTNAISNGLLLLSVNDDGEVVFDSGVTTLVKPDKNQDDGWKKIKRVKVRHETFYRLDKQMEKLIGKVNCDSDGIANVIQQGQMVLDEMAKERKLIDPTFIIDSEKGYGGDTAHFIIDAVDIDTLERIFLNYQFKYSENS